jgi:cytochrome c-type biogenesis protein CcmH/NrfG
MEGEPNPASAAGPTASQVLQAKPVYTMAVICLAAGIAIGYLLLGSQTPVASVPQAAGAMGGRASGMTPMSGRLAQPTVNGAPQAPPEQAMGTGRMPTLEEMKQMADKQAAPLLQKLKTDPKNSAVLMQVGAIYHGTHQFKEAAAYFSKAVAVDPKNVPLRTKLASSLYRSGDVDGAITQLNQALSYDPADANALFDLGLIRLQGKQDSKGALAAWRQLLKTNPQLSPDRKAAVQKLMADVLTTESGQRGTQGAGSHDGHK